MKPTHTVGFIFDKNFKNVLLMRKNRPDWQSGKLNGPGGKIEEGESSLDCVQREILEECDLDIKKDDWVLCSNVTAHKWSVDFYGAVWQGEMNDAQKMTDEELEWIPVSKIPDNVIPNLKWLIPMTLSKTKGDDDFVSAQIHYEK